jgi:hypothetical protein
VFNTLTEYLHTQQSDLALDFNFASLRSAFSELDSFRNSGEKDNSQSPSLYTRATVVDFHYLLLTVLAGYRAGLRQLADNSSPQSSDDYDGAWLFTFLLWRIAHSSILREHLAFLHKAGLLSRLADDVVSGTVDFGMEKGGAEADDVGEEAAEVTDQEMSFMLLHVEPTNARQQPDMGLVVLRWIHLLVCHITALETLSLFFRREVLGDTKLNIQVVTLRPTPVEQTPWKPVVQRALQSQAPFLYDRYDKIITILADCIQESQRNMEGRKPFHYFTEEVMQVTGNVHCGAALACLVKCSTAAIYNEGTEFQIDVWLFP